MKKRFIFDENYIKRYAKKDQIKWLIIGVAGLILVVIIIIVVMATRKQGGSPVKPVLPEFEFKEELVLEAGSSLPAVEDYFDKLENIDIDEIEIEYPEEFEIGYDISKCSDEEREKISTGDLLISDASCALPVLKSPKLFGVTLKIQNKEYTVKLRVEDTKAPTLKLQDVEIFQGEEYKLEDFVVNCSDITSECKLKFYDKSVDSEGNAIDYASFKEAGDYTVKIVAEDGYQNVTEPTDVKLTIKSIVKPVYSVVFDTSGGSQVAGLTVEEGSKVIEPDIPSRSGYTFVGWYYGDEKFNFDTPVNADITLVAKWQKNSGGGTSVPGVIPVRSVSLDYGQRSLYIGESKPVEVTINPKNATNRAVTWSSSNNSVAVVDNNGNITGVGSGTAMITATVEGKSASVKITVIEKTSYNPGGDSCSYGDTSYNSSKYTLSVNLTRDNCAIDPNTSPNEDVSVKDYVNLVNRLSSMGFVQSEGYFSYKLNTIKVKNNAGTGLVGYQFTVSVTVIDPNTGKYMSASYVIQPNGSRKFITNNISKNGMTLN